MIKTYTGLLMLLLATAPIQGASAQQGLGTDSPYIISVLSDPVKLKNFCNVVANDYYNKPAQNLMWGTHAAYGIQFDGYHGMQGRFNCGKVAVLPISRFNSADGIRRTLYVNPTPCGDAERIVELVESRHWRLEGYVYNTDIAKTAVHNWRGKKDGTVETVLGKPSDKITGRHLTRDAKAVGKVVLTVAAAGTAVVAYNHKEYIIKKLAAVMQSGQKVAVKS